jgi:glycosyltransferase involved in cell wall biosynthesis
MAFISAIIPVHNRFEFLNETLVSVFSQTRVPDEVLLVDDCSSSSLEDFLARNPPPGPVKILHTDRQRNVGGARNWGWQRAQGDLIAFNDSDDLWELDKTRMQAGYLESHPELDGVYGPMVAFFPDGKTQPWAHDRPLVVDAATALTGAHMTTQTLMIRRQALEKLGGFDERLSILEDEVFSIETGRMGLRVVFLPSPVVTRLRRNDRNITRNTGEYLVCECQIALRYRRLSAETYGPGSVFVHVSRAVERFGARTRFMNLPAKAAGYILRALAPASRMPRARF